MQEVTAPGILVSMPNLNDPYFQKTVILLCEYTAETAFGVVVNRPSNIHVRDLLEGDELLLDQSSKPFLVGGPVQPDFLWAVHTPDFAGESTTEVDKAVFMSSVQEILLALSEQDGPSHYHMGFGYAGWGPGQLDKELREGSWWVAPMDKAVILDAPFGERWQQVWDSLGIDPIAANFGTTGEA